ncbi:MAG: hypothetical protein EOO60_13615, partial [Hymenobacter sp.]
MSFSPVSFRSYFAPLLSVVALLFIVSSCGGDKGKVEGANTPYGSGSKTWVTDKQTDAAGDKVAMSDATKEQNNDLTAELEELRKSLVELKA